MTGRWGKAGVRLTELEAKQRAQRRGMYNATRQLAEQRTKQAWSQGRVIPYRITTALDWHRLEGPDVDEACGAKEPDVDMWEAGTLYPTWEQLCLLAELTQFPVAFFVTPYDVPLLGDTSMRYHRIGGQCADYRQPPIVRCFTPEALAAIKEQP